MNLQDSRLHALKKLLNPKPSIVERSFRLWMRLSESESFWKVFAIIAVAIVAMAFVLAL